MGARLRIILDMLYVIKDKNKLYTISSYFRELKEKRKSEFL